ncbi:MAG: ABC transporter ATP-binding protein [Lachnospiraceae bacterium]|nr:ABC transporter ATP-binding protein [Lachnospiraceae bacterium]
MIEVKDLTFSYGKGLRGKDKQALRGLNFTVGDGEIFGFLGPNGSGKSTTQKILTGILKGHGGMVSVFGKDLRSVHTREFYQKIGVLFEFPYLYANLSALDNLHYFSSFYPKEQLRDAEELLDELEFKKDFRRKPVSSYSKGMRQRVSMARALISSPKLLFLDEPTSGLDPSGAVLFRRIIESERKKGTTVFVTTHNMLDADLLCDRVAFIAGGKMVALDTPGNLKEMNGNHSVVVNYLYQGRRGEKTMEASELKEGVPFPCDELISVHSKEPTLEDIFIRYTGRGLS